MSDSDTSSDSHMNFCEDCGTDFNGSDVDAHSGEEDRCQECIRSMRVGVSLSAVEAWTERKIKRKAKREKISEDRARAGFSWDVEDWRHEESSDVDVDSDDGAEEVVVEEEGKGVGRKRGFEVVGKVETVNCGQARSPGATVPIQQEGAVAERLVKRARLRKESPKPQGNTTAVKKNTRQPRELMNDGGRVLRSGKSYRDFGSLQQDEDYDADAEE